MTESLEPSGDDSAEPGTDHPQAQERRSTGPGEPASEPGTAAEVATVLSTLAELPVEEHPDVYEAVHRRLGDTLSGIDHV